MTLKKSTQIWLFSALCFAGGLVNDITLGIALERQKLPGTGGTVGPIQVENANDVFRIDIYQDVPLGRWSAVDVSLLDENQDYVVSFGDELWDEDGYDSEGYWRESKDDYDMKITFPEPGLYYLDVSADGNLGDGQDNHAIYVGVYQKLGASLYFYVAAFASLLAGFAVRKFE